MSHLKKCTKRCRYQWTATEPWLH